MEVGEGKESAAAGGGGAEAHRVGGLAFSVPPLSFVARPANDIYRKQFFVSICN